MAAGGSSVNRWPTRMLPTGPVSRLPRCVHKSERSPPAEADFQCYFKVTPPVVHQMILTLDRLGLITRSPGMARSIRLNVRPEEIPRLE